MDIGVLDFSKAFDTVPRPHLLKKLEHLGIRGDLYHWLTYFLTERDQRVVIEGSYSIFLHIDWGDTAICTKYSIFGCYVVDRLEI